MPIAHLQHFSCHYLQLKPSCGKTQEERQLVFVHGLATNLAFWYYLAQDLAADTEVTLLDLRGHGKSSMPKQGYTSDQMAADLKELLDQLGIQTATLIGHSFGGAVALQFALQYPDQTERLVLADTRLRVLQPIQPPTLWPNWPQLQPELAQLGILIEENETDAGYRMLIEMARLHVNSSQNTLPLPARLAALFPRTISKRLSEQWLRLLDTTTAWQDFTAVERLSVQQLQQLQIPTLTVYGEHSPTLPTAWALKALWPQTQLEFIPAAGHFFPLSQPNPFKILIQRFMRQELTHNSVV